MDEKKKRSGSVLDKLTSLVTPRPTVTPRTPTSNLPEKLEEKTVQRKDSMKRSPSMLSPMPVSNNETDVNNLSPREGELEEDPELLKVSTSELLKDSKKSGYLEKEGGSIKTWKKRFFILHDNYLFYFEDESSKEAKGYIVLDYPKAASRSETQKNCLQIITWSTRTYHLIAESDFVLEAWIQAINQAVIPLKNKHIVNARMSGWILKRGKNPDKVVFNKRYLVIDNRFLYVFRTPDDALPKFRIDTSLSKISRVDKAFGGKESLQVSSKMRNFIFQSEFSDIKIWEYALKEASEKLASGLDLNTTSLKGWFELDTAKKTGFKPYFLVARETSLYFFASDKDKNHEYMVELRGKIITRTDKELGIAFTFKIESASNIFFIKAKNEDEVSYWISKLKELSKSDVGDLSKSGYLTKQGGSIKTWKKRYFVLKNNDLYYQKDPQDPQPKGKITLSGFMIRILDAKEAKEEADRKYVIKVIQPQRNYLLAADTQQDILEWAIVLRKASLIFQGKVLHVDLFPKKKENYYKTICEAIGFAERGDKIIVHKGEYKEDLSIKKPISIEGEGEVEIFSTRKPCVTMNTLGAASFSGIKFIQNSTSSDMDCISLKQGHLHFDNCSFESKSGNGIVVNGISHLSMTGSLVKHCKQYGITTTETSSLLIENSVISQNGWDGLMFSNETEVMIRGSSINNNSYNGVCSASEGRITIEHCNIHSNVWDGVSVKSQKSQCVLYNNQIFHNKGYGIYYQIPVSSKKKFSINDIDPQAGKIEADNKIYDNEKGSKNF